VRLEQRVERVEEFLLRHLLAFEEMHVVHQEQVHVVAVAPPELRHRPRVNRLDHLVDELLGAEILEPHLGVLLQHRVGDRLHQVRLAEAGRAVDEQRVVGLSRRFGDGVSRGGGELVRFADDERLEGVALVERRRGDGELVACGAGVAWRDEEIHLRSPLAILLHAEHDAGGSPEDPLGRAGEHSRVLRLVPLDGELIRGPDDQPPVVERDRLGRLEPRPHCRVGEFTPRLVEEALPGFLC